MGKASRRNAFHCSPAYALPYTHYPTHTIFSILCHTARAHLSATSSASALRDDCPRRCLAITEDARLISSAETSSFVLAATPTAVEMLAVSVGNSWSRDRTCQKQKPQFRLAVRADGS